MLIDPKNSCSSSRQWVALVVGHELAHQWFGNLVTMVFNIFKCSNISIYVLLHIILASLFQICYHTVPKKLDDRSILF